MQLYTVYQSSGPVLVRRRYLAALDDTQKKRCAIEGRKVGTVLVRKMPQNPAKIGLLGHRHVILELRLN